MSDKRMTDRELHELLSSVQVEPPPRFRAALRDRLRRRLIEGAVGPALGKRAWLQRLPIWRHAFSENGGFHQDEGPRRFSLAPALSTVIILVVAAALLTVGLPSQYSDITYEATFTPGECRFEVPEGYAVDCGDLTVPEDRRQPDGRTVRLHVAIFRSISPHPAPDPLIYLGGEAGANHLALSDTLMREIGHRVLAQRDFIVFNLRGSAYSDPELGCPGFDSFLAHINGASSSTKEPLFSREERETETIEFLLDCRRALAARGIDLAMYDTAASAADANDLRAALGYEQANYYATSDGTRVALALVRDHPEGMRSVVLDSVYPPQASPLSERGANAYDALSLLFETCADKPECGNWYTYVEESFFQAVDTLNESPSVINWDGELLSYDGDDYIDAVATNLGSCPYADMVPAIWFSGARDYSLIEPFIPGAMGLETADRVSPAAAITIDCREEISFDSLDAYRALSDRLPPQIAAHYDPSFEFELCSQWDVPPANPIANAPVWGDVPTLVLAGELDPITPPRWAEMAAETLSHSYLYEFPSRGHEVTRYDSCAVDIAMQFLDDLTVESCPSCLLGCRD
jgi:pimeloyl-ACP methyl ester carboxylesterase